MNKEFDYDFAEIGEFFSTSWTAKKLEFEKSHSKEIKEEIRFENLTDKKLEIYIKKHELLKHPKKVVLAPKEVKHVVIKIPCERITDKHESYLEFSSKNQKEIVPVKIKHSN